MTGQWVVLAATLALAAQLPPGAGPEVHGERDVFSAPGVVLAWAVLRGATEEQTHVVLRVALRAPYAYVRVYGVDPFSGERRLMAPGGLVRGTTDLRTPRSTFADHPRREIRLYRTEDDWRADVPALTIYYLGVPDTTPELVSEAALAHYLEDAGGRARRGQP